MRDFHMSEYQAMDYPTDRAWALMAFHAETHPMCPADRVSDGYIAQESLRQRDAARPN